MAKLRTLSSGNPPQVIVTGYYDPFSSKTCDDTAELTSGEISWLKNRVSSLNSAIRGTVVKYSYAKYASISFAGHGLCAADSWVQNPSSPIPFHPTAAGQQKIADAVLAKYTQPSKSKVSTSARERALDWYQRIHRNN